jgi:hypothetical protein
MKKPTTKQEESDLILGRLITAVRREKIKGEPLKERNIKQGVLNLLLAIRTVR